MAPYLKLFGLSIAFLVSIFGSLAAEALSGRVVDASGGPLPGVLVEDVAADHRTLSSADGAFTLPSTTFPVVLRFSLDGYGEGEYLVESETGAPITLRLAIHTIEGEKISVSARAPAGPLVPASLASTTLRADASPGLAAALADVATQSPAVSESGQGGLFQVVSVRGVSRQRLRTLVAGVPVTSERRAGASASFVDPELLGAVEVVRGPVSSAYGSGALGGVIQAGLRGFDGASVATGFESQGESRFAAAGWGDDAAGWNGGLAFRQAANGTDGRGEDLNNGFTQASAFVSREWAGAELLLLGSSATDIGKPNTDFPERITIYPTEKHFLLRLGVDAPKGWRIDTFAHSNGLETRTTEDTGAVADVKTSGLDLGFGARRQWGRYRIGIDYFGRRDVNARERQQAPETGDTFARPLQGAEEDEVGVSASTSWTWGPARFEGGGRWTWHRQQNGSPEDESDSTIQGSAIQGSAIQGSAIEDSAPSFFVGLVLPVSANFELLANAGTGLRFPSLSERFFSGTTGRGQAIANADLEPEESETIDVGARWFTSRSAVSIFAYNTRVAGFIERVELEEDLLTFQNLVSGTIQGIEVEALIQLSREWKLRGGGHWTRGRDSLGDPLEDVPPHRIQATVDHRRGPWQAQATFQHRFRKNDIAGGEKVIPAVDLLDVSVSRDVFDNLSISLLGSNLFDSVYFPSADQKASYAPGRSLGFRLSWRP